MGELNGGGSQLTIRDIVCPSREISPETTESPCIVCHDETARRLIQLLPTTSLRETFAKNVTHEKKSNRDVDCEREREREGGIA